MQLWTKLFVIDGDIICDGQASGGSRAGGGAGGSIYAEADTMRGQGTLIARGGSATQENTNCGGGGGSGGRIATSTTLNTFSGKMLAQGGNSFHECGGAGTILSHDNVTGDNNLVVDNKHVCFPLGPDVKYGKLDDLHRGRDSYRTWMFDDVLIGSHSHNLASLEIAGNAHLALYRRNIDEFDQFIYVGESRGDKSGTFHIGPQQVSNLSM